MTLSEQAAAIAILRAAYPRQPFPDDSVAFYARKLSDLAADELTAAIDRLTNRSTFLPSVAEIRREVAEARLGLPTTAEAWEIAAHGSIRDAPQPVRDAAQFVGGRWAIMYDDNLVAVRAQFREQYDRLREQALLAEAGALPAPYQQPAALTKQAALPPADDRWVPSPVMARAARQMIGIHVDPPSDDEIRDAIDILRPGPLTDEPAEDSLYAAAERVLVDANNHLGGTA